MFRKILFLTCQKTNQNIKHNHTVPSTVQLSGGAQSQREGALKDKSFADRN